MGAWIEIFINPIMPISRFRSHPLWVRGLKYIQNHWYFSPYWSHPLWVRGLKFVIGLGVWGPYPVAPFMGAWIEILKM